MNNEVNMEGEGQSQGSKGSKGRENYSFCAPCRKYLATVYTTRGECIKGNLAPWPFLKVGAYGLSPNVVIVREPIVTNDKL